MFYNFFTFTFGPHVSRYVLVYMSIPFPLFQSESGQHVKHLKHLIF